MRHDDSTIQGLRNDARPRKQAWPQHAARIFQNRRDEDRTRRSIHLPVHREQPRLVRKRFSVREDQLDELLPLIERLGDALLDTVRRSEVFRFADREEDLNGIEGGDRREHRAVRRADEIAHLRPCNTDNTINRRGDLAEVQVQLCLFQVGLERLDLRGVRFVKLQFVRMLPLRNDLLVEEFLAAFGLRLGGELHCLALIELAFCLRERCNKRPRIDLE